MLDADVDLKQKYGVLAHVSKETRDAILHDHVHGGLQKHVKHIQKYLKERGKSRRTKWL